MTTEHKNQDNIADLEEKLKAARKEKRKSDALIAATELVRTTGLHYITKLDRYARMDAMKQWHFIKPAALYRTYSLFNDKDFRLAFDLAMEDAGRVFLDCTYSFAEYPDTLNMMDVSDWLPPGTGEHHWIFDVLMQSLGGDKFENIEHLKHVIAFKYGHPDCWLLPCIVMFGEGRVGKNILVDSILYTIFARQTISATSENLISTFNSLLEGKMAVLVNETVVGKHDRTKLYNQLAKARTTINMKGVAQYDVDNTPLFFIGSNDWHGGTLLDRSQADERLSILCCPKGMGLKHWVAKHQGVSADDAEQWLWTTGKDIFVDKMEVAKWLGHLIAVYGHREQPRALHGADFREVMDIQTKIDESILEAVFRDEDFDYVSVVDLYDGYLAVCEARNTRFTVFLKTFNKQAEMWLKDHEPRIVKRKITFLDDRSKKVRKTVWTRDAIFDDHLENDNRSKYLCKDGYKNVWTGPEVG